MLSYQQIKRYASDAGFVLCGVARARVLTERSEPYRAAIAISGPDGLDYLARGYERRLDPAALVKGARTVVVCALAYPRGDYSSAVRTAAFAQCGEDYHVRIKGMLREVLERLRSDFAGVADLRAKVCCDTSPLLEKAWAIEAGIGWQGRNSLMINPEYGSFLLLGEIILDVECDRYDAPYQGSGCGDCRACVVACPVGALSAGISDGAPDDVVGSRAGGVVGAGIVDTSRCISALTVENLRRNHPAEPICGWGYGCDECQLACPFN